MQYYDRLLGGMFLSLVVGAAAGTHPTVDFHRALFGGAILATLLFWQAVFRNPPVSVAESRARERAIGVGWHLALLLYLALVW